MSYSVSLGGTMPRNEAKRIQQISGRFRVSMSLLGQTQCGPCRPTKEQAQEDLDAILAGSTAEEKQELLEQRRRLRQELQRTATPTRNQVCYSVCYMQ